MFCQRLDRTSIWQFTQCRIVTGIMIRFLALLEKCFSERAYLTYRNSVGISRQKMHYVHWDLTRGDR